LATQETKERQVRIQNRLGLTEGVETLVAQERRMSQVANNLANVNSTGFKKENQTFWEMLYSASGGQPRVGKAPHVVVDFSHGPMHQTGNTLDFAIHGEGFFKIGTPAGTRYTRGGNFLLNAERQLVTQDGYQVLGDGGPIIVDGDELTVALDGRVFVDGTEVDRLSTVAFETLEGMELEGSGLFRMRPGGPPEETPDGTEVRQGHIEGSNVNVVREMTEMIDLHRAFETQQRIVRTFDDIDEQAIRKVGNLTS